MFRRVYGFLFVFIILSVAGTAQTTMSLQQCIDSALAHNIPTQQKYLSSLSAEVDLRQSRTNLFPSFSADVTHGISQGRFIDPTSNGYVNNSFNYASYNLNSNLPVFSGGTLRNNIRQSVAAYEASKYEWQQAKDNLVLDVILDYLQILNNEDLLKSAINQAEVSNKQVERAEILDKQGAIKPSDLADYRGQLMNDQLAIVNSRNALETARLALQQLMNRPYDPAMQFQRIDVSEFLTPYTNTPDSVYQTALEQFSLIKAVEARNKSYYYGVKSARGYLYPYLYLGGGLTTNYSSTAQTSAGKIPYNSQLTNNIGSGVYVGLSIPIFNHMLFRNRIKQAEIALKNSELNEQNTKVQLHQQIEQAYLNMTNAYERYKVLLEQVNAYTESFKAAEVRFNSGVGTSIDYLTAKDRLDRANINLINAKYDFVLRKKILDYYTNSTH